MEDKIQDLIDGKEVWLLNRRLEISPCQRTVAVDIRDIAIREIFKCIHKTARELDTAISMAEELDSEIREKVFDSLPRHKMRETVSQD